MLNKNITFLIAGRKDDVLTSAATEQLKTIGNVVIFEKNRDFIKQFNNTLILSFGYTSTIDNELLDAATYGGINLHMSLLPNYKGYFPIPWTIIKNEEFAGYTYHIITDKIDAGDILLQKKFKVGRNTAYELHSMFISSCIEDILSMLTLFFEGKRKRQNSGGSYFSNKLPYGGIINKSWSIFKIDRFIRAMNFPSHFGSFVKVNDYFVEVNNINQYIEAINV